ncbi:uncharacterized protein LOC118478451 [Aplysia californica]|uniref:Uncharacterized protein LOC118478451 n=1 Tax=Aplysia californica TaxID=6500 RepID=A0ABM1VZW3_APLCA|nr:uncharacterized protein LOC118478451 [Aplysia californica]
MLPRRTVRIDVLEGVAHNGNHLGRAFMLSFLPNHDHDSTNVITIVTEQQTTVYVKIPTLDVTNTYSMNQWEYLYVQLPQDTTSGAWGPPETTAVSIFSDQLICVKGVTTQLRSTGGYLAVPLDKWSDHYMVATYDRSTAGAGGEIVIISARDGTTVNIWLNVASTASFSGYMSDLQHTIRKSATIHTQYEGPQGSSSGGNHLFQEFILPPDSVMELTSNLPVLVVVYSQGALFNDNDTMGNVSLVLCLMVHLHHGEEMGEWGRGDGDEKRL